MTPVSCGRNLSLSTGWARLSTPSTGTGRRHELPVCLRALPQARWEARLRLAGFSTEVRIPPQFDSAPSPTVVEIATELVLKLQDAALMNCEHYDNLVSPVGIEPTTS